MPTLPQALAYYVQQLPAIYRNKKNAVATTQLVVTQALGDSQTEYPYEGQPFSAGWLDSMGNFVINETGQLLIDDVANAFDLELAGGQQLDWIAKYIGLNRDIAPNSSTRPYFQFVDYNAPSTDNVYGFLGYEGTGNRLGVFCSYTDQGATVTALTDSTFGYMLILKAYTNRMTGNIYDILDFLENGLVGTPLEGLITVQDINFSNAWLSPGNLVIGQSYTIVYHVGGGQDWTAVGAADNNQGTVFTATGTGTLGLSGEVSTIPVMFLQYTVDTNVQFLSQNANGTLTTMSVADANSMLLNYLPRPMGCGIGIARGPLTDARVLEDDYTVRTLADGSPRVVTE